MITLKMINKVDAIASEEIEKFGPPKILTDLANINGARLATTLKADKGIVALGTRLMDLKLGECIKNNKPQEHIIESAKKAKEILAELGISGKEKEKIINCIEAHHNKKYICIEAEICANADCYKFLTPKGIFCYAMLLAGERKMEFSQTIKAIEEKMEEKYDLLSLAQTKKELMPNYLEFKKIFKEIKND